MTAHVIYNDPESVQYENSTILILHDGVVQPVVVKDILRPIAAEVGVDLLTAKGRAKNTRALGTDVVRAVTLRSARSPASQA